MIYSLKASIASSVREFVFILRIYGSIFLTFPRVERAYRFAACVDVPRCWLLCCLILNVVTHLLSYHRLSLALRDRGAVLPIQHIHSSTTTHGCPPTWALSVGRCVKSTAQLVSCTMWCGALWSLSAHRQMWHDLCRSHAPTAKAQIAQFLTAYDSNIRHEHL